MVAVDSLPAWSLIGSAPAVSELAFPPGREAAREWAWGGSTGEGVTVCVLDSGIEPGHPQVGDIARAVVVEGDADGYCQVRDEAPCDPAGHGTACAGIIRRVAPGCALMSVRVLSARAAGQSEVLLAGLTWAMANGADVINLSLSTRRSHAYRPLSELADSAYFQGKIIVASAHNEPVISFPWSFASVISVASHSEPGDDVFYINPEPPVEIYGPGVRQRAAWKGGREAVLSGNSLAAPHIAGRCALILSKHRNLRPFEVKSILWQTANNITGV